MSASRGHPRQAVILVGGEGTRLRPVTSRVPKPVAPVVERPFVSYILDNLARHGVERAVFSTGFLAEAIEAVIGNGSAYGIEVAYAVEEQPLGTAGAIANCEAMLRDGSFFVFNGDVLSDVDLSALAASHAAKGGMGTIFLTPVEDPRRYGLVEVREDGSVVSFLEKPGEWEGDRAHQRRRVRPGAGSPGDDPARQAVLHRAGGVPQARLGRIALRACGRRLLARHRHPGQLSAGALRHPRTAARDERRGRARRPVPLHRTDRGDHVGARVVPPCYVADGVHVGAGARVGPLAVLGAGASVGEGATVTEAVVQAGVVIGAHAQIEGSILVQGSSVGAGTQLNGAVLGEGCVVGAGNRLAGGICVYPETELPDNSIQFYEQLRGREGT